MASSCSREDRKTFLEMTSLDTEAPSEGSAASTAAEKKSGQAMPDLAAATSIAAEEAFEKRRPRAAARL